MFPTVIGTPTDPRNALRAFASIAERAGLAGVGLHTLRHSAASALIASGAHLKVVQELLAHSSYGITRTSVPMWRWSSSVRQLSGLARCFRGEQRYCSR